MDSVIALQLLNVFTAAPYEPMTFPHFRPRLMSTSAEGSAIACGASCDGRPVGLALAEVSADRRTAEMLSIYVAPAFRNRGVGTILLAHLEATLRTRGCTQVGCAYLAATASRALERVLEKQRWSEPAARMLVCRGQHGRMLEAPAIKRARLPAGFSIVPWLELGVEERAHLRGSGEQCPWYPEMFSPFREEENLAPAYSLALGHQGRIVGWLMTHVVLRDVLRYSNFFVSEDFRHAGCGLPLLAAALRRRVESHGVASQGSFAVWTDNESMVRFVRRVTPFLLWVRETKGSVKALL